MYVHQVQMLCSTRTYVLLSCTIKQTIKVMLPVIHNTQIGHGTQCCCVVLYLSG